MAGQITGADAAQLRDLAQKFDRAASDLQTLEVRLSAAINGTAAWQGGDAAMFRSTWNSQHRALLRSSGSVLTNGAESLRKNATEQDHASAGTGGAGAAVAADSSVTDDLGELGAKVGETLREINDWLQSGWNILGTGAWISHAVEAATAGLGDAMKALADLRAERTAAEGVLAAIEAMKAQGITILESTLREGEEAASLLARTGDLESSLASGIKGAGFFEALGGLSKLVDGAGILGDVATIIDPEDSGALGWVDRGVAGVNGGLLAANLMLDEIPVVGEVVMVGTGVYLAGDYLYHHWTPFRNAANYVGHNVADAAEWTYHEAGDVVQDVGDVASDAGHEVSHLTSSAVHGAGSVIHKLGGLIP